MLMLKPPAPTVVAEMSAAAALVKQLLPAVGGRDGVEHVAIRADPAGLQLGLFTQGADPEIALRHARQACQRLTVENAAFADWEVQDY